MAQLIFMAEHSHWDAWAFGKKRLALSGVENGRIERTTL